MTIVQQVLNALEAHGLKPEGAGKYRCKSSPFRPGSDSNSFTLVVSDDDIEWYDHRDERGGRLPSLARALNIEISHEAAETKRKYSGIAEYAQAHGISAEVLAAAGWKETSVGNRRALEFPTATGKRWRYIDGKQPYYTSAVGYKKCWYGLNETTRRRLAYGAPLVICNGEISTVAAQHYGLAAACVTSGESVIPAELFTQLKETVQPDHSILVALDCDDKGRETTRKLVLQLRNAGYQRVEAIDLGFSRGGDLADFVTLHGMASLGALNECKRIEAAPAMRKYGLPEDRILASGTSWITVAADTLSLLPHVSWIVKGEIPDHGMTVLFGPSGVGKSFAAIDYALRIAQERPVLYAAGEGEYGVDSRIKAWCKHHGRNPGKLFITMGTVGFMDGSEADLFIEQHRQIKPNLIIIDTLARSMVGADENSTRDMNNFISSVNRIMQELSCAVMLVHHTGHQAIRERGSSVLRAASDSMIQLSDEDDLIRYECAKSKDAKPFPSRYMKMLPVDTGLMDEDGNVIMTPVMVDAEKVIQTELDELTVKQRKVMDIMGMDIFEYGATFGEIHENSGIAEKRTVTRILSRLKAMRLIKQEAKGEPYLLTEKGREALVGEIGAMGVIGVHIPEKSKSDLTTPLKERAIQPIQPITPTNGHRRKMFDDGDETYYHEGL